MVMTQFVLNIKKIVPYHEASPNTRNGARLRSPSPIMAPVTIWLGVIIIGFWNVPLMAPDLT